MKGTRDDLPQPVPPQMTETRWCVAIDTIASVCSSTGSFDGGGGAGCGCGEGRGGAGGDGWLVVAAENGDEAAAEAAAEPVRSSMLGRGSAEGGGAARAAGISIASYAAQHGMQNSWPPPASESSYSPLRVRPHSAHAPRPNRRRGGVGVGVAPVAMAAGALVPLATIAAEPASLASGGGCSCAHGSSTNDGR